MIVDYTHCIHCDKPLKEQEFNEDYLMETIYDEFDIQQRYVCKKCYESFYKFKGETNDWKRKRNI